MTKGLRNSGTLRRFMKRDSANPMDGVANLADCMLVLACGLMLSLIINWNLDIQIDEQLTPTGENQMETVENMEDSELDNPNVVSGFEEFGTLYRDPVTGEYYVVKS